MKKVRLIGIDCATVDARIGLALGDYESGIVRLKEATLCARERPAVTIAKWLRGAPDEAVLLAIDAPLGWPVQLAHALADHRAGERIGTAANDMFRRATDCFVREQLSKIPLDVGADRIARTAHAALRLLGELRNELGVPIPLAWTPVFLGVAAIEVYPAATLVAHGYLSTGYKQPKQIAERCEVVASVGAAIDIGGHEASLEKCADVLDAAVCLLAAKDFLDAHALPPQDIALAEREGWIWVAPRQFNRRSNENLVPK